MKAAGLPLASAHLNRNLFLYCTIPNRLKAPSFHVHGRNSITLDVFKHYGRCIQGVRIVVGGGRCQANHTGGGGDLVLLSESSCLLLNPLFQIFLHIGSDCCKSFLAVVLQLTNLCLMVTVPTPGTTSTCSSMVSIKQCPARVDIESSRSESEK